MIGKSDDGSDSESQHSVLGDEDAISIEDALDRRSADVERLTLGELTAAADVSVRTVRYYIAEGLLPPPEGSGPGSAYTQGHLDRLRLIQRLKEAYLPLKEIRRRLSGLRRRRGEGVCSRPAITGHRQPRRLCPRNGVRQVAGGGAGLPRLDGVWRAVSNGADGASVSGGRRAAGSLPGWIGFHARASAATGATGGGSLGIETAAA